MTTTKIGSWIDNECYYVSVIDGKRWGLVLGPFREHQDALDMVDTARDIAVALDGATWFYAWGTCKMIDGKRDGVLNKHMDGNGWTGFAKDCPAIKRNPQTGRVMIGEEI